MNGYELVTILTPDADEDMIAASTEKLTRFIEDHGGSVDVQENWGMQRLAQSVKRFKDGNYLMTRFNIEPRWVRELDSTLVSSEEIIRHLLLRRDSE